MKLNLIDFNEEFKDLPIVSSPSFMYRLKSFHKDGIFSEQIFGPVNDYQCQCGKYRGKANENITCDICGVTVTSSEMRRSQFARIIIPETIIVVNPVVINILDNYNLKCINFKVSSVINGQTYLLEDSSELIVSTKEDKNAITGPYAFKYILYPYLLQKENQIKDFDRNYGKMLYIYNLPVIPPDTRPIMRSSKDEKQFFSDQINEKYLNILRELSDIQYSPFIFFKTHLTMQYKVNKLFKALMGKFEKKTGFLRSHVLGKRIDYSGRAVITVDGVNLPLGWCKIPFTIAREIYKPQVIYPLSKELGISPLNALKEYYKPAIKESLLKILKSMFVGTFVFINRQPTLHRPSFQSAKIYDIIEDDVIVIHPLITDSYNAD